MGVQLTDEHLSWSERFTRLKVMASNAATEVSNDVHAVGQTVSDGVTSAEQAAFALAEKVVSLLKQAGQIAMTIGADVKALMTAISDWSDGCMGVITTAIGSASALLAAIAVFVAGIPADATGIGAAVGVPAQVAALAAAIAAATLLMSSIVGVVECKDLQAKAARDAAEQKRREAEQAAADRRRDDEIKALKEAMAAAQEQARKREENAKQVHAKGQDLGQQVEKLKQLAGAVGHH